MAEPSTGRLGLGQDVGLGPSCPLTLAPPALLPTQQQDMGADVPLCLQDTTDYVAYVAKDPINQRGDTVLHTWELGGGGMHWGVKAGG